MAVQSDLVARGFTARTLLQLLVLGLTVLAMVKSVHDGSVHGWSTDMKIYRDVAITPLGWFLSALIFALWLIWVMAKQYLIVFGEDGLRVPRLTGTQYVPYKSIVRARMRTTKYGWKITLESKTGKVRLEAAYYKSIDGLVSFLQWKCRGATFQGFDIWQIQA